MSTKGSEVRQLDRDHNKFRKNFDGLDLTDYKPIEKIVLEGKDAPDGVKCRIIYGRKA
jgi:hypothetical protein